MKHFHVIIFCISIVFPLFAQNIKPVWLTNPKTQYPSNLYLTSIGEGDTRQEAENNALANISLIFSSSINVNNELIQNYSEKNSATNSNLTEESQFTQNINIGSSQTLYNIKFAESYTGDDGKIYVLACINRSKTADIYINRINNNDEKISYFLDKSSDNQNDILKYAYVNAAEYLAKLNEMLFSQLEIINFSSSRKINFNSKLKTITELKSEKAKEISFHINIKNDSEGQINKTIEKILTNQGFVIKQNSLLYVNGTLDIIRIEMNREGKFVRWKIDLNIQNSEGEIILTSIERGREGQLTYEGAESRAVNSICKLLTNKFKDDLEHYFLKFIE